MQILPTELHCLKKLIVDAHSGSFDCSTTHRLPVRFDSCPPPI